MTDPLSTSTSLQKWHINEIQKETLPHSLATHKTMLQNTGRLCSFGDYVEKWVPLFTSIKEAIIELKNLEHDLDPAIGLSRCIGLIRILDILRKELGFYYGLLNQIITITKERNSEVHESANNPRAGKKHQQKTPILEDKIGKLEDLAGFLGGFLRELEDGQENESTPYLPSYSITVLIMQCMCILIQERSSNEVSVGLLRDKLFAHLNRALHWKGKRPLQKLCLPRMIYIVRYQALDKLNAPTSYHIGATATLAETIFFPDGYFKEARLARMRRENLLAFVKVKSKTACDLTLFVINERLRRTFDAQGRMEQHFQGIKGLKIMKEEKEKATSRETDQIATTDKPPSPLWGEHFALYQKAEENQKRILDISEHSPH